MMKKWMLALALTLVAPAAFSTTSAMPKIHKKASKVKAAVSADGGQTAAQLKTLRAGIKQDKSDLSAKRKGAKSARAQMLAQEKAELAAVAKTEGTRAEKTHARQAVRAKYAKMTAEARTKRVDEAKWLREDISAKRAQILKLRRSS